MLEKEKYGGFFGGLYKRNETYFILSAVLLLVSILVGYAFAGFLTPLIGPMLGNFKHQISSGQIKISTSSIFLNNLNVAFHLYFGGLIIGIGTAYYLIFNGAFIGYTAAQLPLGSFLIYTVPHGIFELIGIIIAGAAGFRLASCVLNILKDLTHMRSDISFSTQFKYVIELHVDEFWESLKLMLIAAIFLLVAAFIEANITINLGNYITSVT